MKQNSTQIKIIIGSVLGISTIVPVFASADAIEEVVVTAQRRSESLQDVPLSITAVTAKDLQNAGIQTSQDLPMVTPGLRVDAIGAFVKPAIRGITTTQTSAGGEPNVATYLDGVYQHLQTAAVFDLPDVNQIEVLKGPQGTLFGRNATGGAILILTLDPDLENVNGFVSGRYGNFNSSELKAFGSAPLIEDKLAFSLTGFQKDTDGYKHDILNGGRGGEVEAQLLRAKLRFLPWDGADFVLTALYSNLDDYNSLKYTNLDGNNVTPLLGLDPALVPSGPYDYATDAPGYSGVEENAVSLRGEIAFGPGVLSTTTSYSKYDTKTVIDSDYTPASLVTIVTPGDSEVYSQELVYATDQLGAFRAVVGLFYFNAESSFTPVNINNFAFANYTTDDVEAIAAFGEATYDITDKLSLTAGVRYSKEDVAAYSFIAFAPGYPDDIPLLGKKTFNSVTPRISLLYAIEEDTNFYASYSEGFKSGVFNSTALQQDAVDPEEVSALEIGVKSPAVENFNYSLAAFYYDYTDLQVTTYDLVGTVLVSSLQNAAQAQIYGAEFNADWNVTTDFNLSIALGYLHARYDSFPAASVTIPTGFGGNTTVASDVSGNSMIRSPEWAGSITANYVKSLSFGDIDFAGTLFYSSKIYHDVGNRIEQPAHTLLNASIGWSRGDSGLNVKLWGRNLTDEEVITSTVLQDVGDGVAFAPPRTYGVEVGYTF